MSALFGALAMGAAASAQSTRRPLPVCITGNTPPLALDSATSGFEVDLAAALARSLGRMLVVVPIDPDDGPGAEAALAARQCDLVMGMTVDGDSPPSGIRLTRPYYRAGFMLVRRRETAVASPHLSVDERLGVDRAAEDVIYPLRQAGVPLTIAPSGEDVIDRVRHGRLHYGLLWGPWAAWALRDTTSDATRGLVLDAATRLLPAGTGPWAFAIGMRSDSAERSIAAGTDSDRVRFDAVDRAVATLVADGTLRRLLTESQLTCCVAPLP